MHPKIAPIGAVVAPLVVKVFKRVLGNVPMVVPPIYSTDTLLATIMRVQYK